jgi:NAD(P)-dependent dehydrogenase (short-subunit alcohol dehydrogenase family)
VRRYGQLDILHNNAAATGRDVIGLDFDVATADSLVWDKTMAVNIRGVMLGCKYALKQMRPRKPGVIINTSSAASSMGDLGRAAYAASKSAVDSITQHVATRYGKEGIRCVGVSPGLILTAAAFTILSEEERTRLTRHNALPRAGAPDDIAGAAPTRRQMMRPLLRATPCPSMAA